MKEANREDNNQLIREIRGGNQRVLEVFYTSYRKAFFTWAGRNFPACDEAQFSEAWQEAVVAIYEQVSSGKLRELTCAPKTYAFLLARRYLIGILRQAARKDSRGLLPEDAVENLLAGEAWEDPWREEKILLDRVFPLLGEQCRELLQLKYERGMSVTEIQAHKKYQSANVVTASLSRCLRRLKDLIFQEKKEDQ
ncbi:MAG: sigma-70 family RNA polymerase sigma factor [Saprospiraceae bacterium]|nr:sigma-70 family RNA polymerase sigma factor [Saprospiraceae bacterium]MBP9210616.1 sigma-70 family RNA polymerase sigma factor [Saprospiraceae bacterium]